MTVKAHELRPNARFNVANANRHARRNAHGDESENGGQRVDDMAARGGIEHGQWLYRDLTTMTFDK